jgi:hypothetical protein
MTVRFRAKRRSNSSPRRPNPGTSMMAVSRFRFGSCSCLAAAIASTTKSIPFTLFAKNEKDNLSMAERNQLAAFVEELKKHFKMSV